MATKWIQLIFYHNFNIKFTWSAVKMHKAICLSSTISFQIIGYLTYYKILDGKMGGKQNYFQQTTNFRDDGRD